METYIYYIKKHAEKTRNLLKEARLELINLARSLDREISDDDRNKFKLAIKKIELATYGGRAITNVWAKEF